MKSCETVWNNTLRRFEHFPTLCRKIFWICLRATFCTCHCAQPFPLPVISSDPSTLSHFEGFSPWQSKRMGFPASLLTFRQFQDNSFFAARPGEIDTNCISQGRLTLDKCRTRADKRLIFYPADNGGPKFSALTGEYILPFHRQKQYFKP